MFENFFGKMEEEPKRENLTKGFGSATPENGPSELTEEDLEGVDRGAEIASIEAEIRSLNKLNELDTEESARLAFLTTKLDNLKSDNKEY